MTVLRSHLDTEALTLTFEAAFDASVEQVWQVWEDRRLLERWWGPPTWPATFERHEFVAGGRSSYYMTGPNGEKSRSWWVTTFIEAPHQLEFDDGFSDESGMPVPDLGTVHTVVSIERVDDQTRMTVVAIFENLDQLEKIMAMGMEEGMRLAMGQIDALLADSVHA